MCKRFNKWAQAQRQVDVVNDRIVPCRTRKNKARRVVYEKMLNAIDNYMINLSSGQVQAKKRSELSLLKNQFGKGRLLSVNKDCADLYLKSKGGKNILLTLPVLSQI